MIDWPFLWKTFSISTMCFFCVEVIFFMIVCNYSLLYRDNNYPGVNWLLVLPISFLVCLAFQIVRPA